MKKRYYLHLFCGVFIRVPRHVYNWCGDHYGWTGLVEIERRSVAVEDARPFAWVSLAVALVAIGLAWWVR